MQKTLQLVVWTSLGICLSSGIRVVAEDPQDVPPQAVAASPGDAAAESAEGPAPVDGDASSLAAVKPRFQLHIPSVQELVGTAQRSTAGKITRHVQTMMDEFGSENGNGIDREVLAAVWSSLRDWPDTSLDLATFAADREGLPRWAFRVDMPIGQLHDRVIDIVESDDAESFFSGFELRIADGGFVAEVNGQPVAFVRSCGTGRTTVASHADLELSEPFFAGVDGEGPVLMSAQLDWSATEKDSGATFLSKFNVVTTIDYTVRSHRDSHWVDELRVNWPPVAGMTLKALLGCTRQTFFVPDEALMAVSFNAIGVQAVLDASVGLTDGDDTDTGVISSFGGSDTCLVVLPGRGFFPIPDVVTQCRISDRDEFEEAMTARIRKLNRTARKNDRFPSWKTVDVRGQRIFIHSGAMQTNGMVLPASMRSVLFVQTADDAKGREREFLVVAATSTNPEEFVEHWLDLPRPEDARFLPTNSGSNAELWVHWQEVFDQIEPYVNLSLVALSTDAVLPAEFGEEIPHAEAVAQLKYEGLRISHQGPVPLAVVVLPSMLSASLQESAGTDLARERLASRRLKVLYHHCRLFLRDTGRWPVEVAELEGYVDFAGHPELLELKASPRKRWSSWLGKIAKSDKDGKKRDEEENDDELYANIDDSLYVVEWRDDVWTLGIAPDTLDHLNQLYIDQEGRLHRVASVAKPASSETTNDDAPE